jgi:hypothetical protein
MERSSGSGDGGSADLSVEIVETLDDCGLDGDDYRLYDTLDVEALEELLESSSGDVEVRFTVEGVRLAATPDGLDVLAGGGSAAGDW